MNAVSLGSIATGSYASGDTQTTIDYIFANPEVLISCCHALDKDDLNTCTSDHLPMYVDSMYTPLQRNHEICSQPWIGWEKAKKTGLIADFQKEVEKCLAPLLNNSHYHAEDS